MLGSGLSTLQVDDNPIKHFLLKFDVTGVNGQSVANAKIRLYNTDAASAGGKFYHVADDSWQEETVTWNNAPAADTNLLAQLGSVSVNTWYEVDVTSLVTGDGTYSFRISDSTGGADYANEVSIYGSVQLHIRFWAYVLWGEMVW